MDTKHLLFFLAVADERNLSRAAKRLKISQPPLTRHIQAFEKKLGVTLFTRTPHGMELTAAGQTLYQDACSVRDLLDQATERARRAGRGETGTLDIGVYGSSLLSVVPQLIAKFTKAYPDVQVQFHCCDKTAQIEALRQRRIAIAFERFNNTEDDLEQIVVANERVCVAVHKSHALADKPSLSIEQLKSATFLLPSSLNSPTGRRMLAIASANGIRPKLALGAGEVISTLSMLASGALSADTVALVPQSTLSLTIDNLLFKPLRVPKGQDATIELHGLYRKGDESPMLVSLLKMIA